mmetsp:Transcript_75360/g.220992  ORF Transcript_75360/g.220992 Transcript_75360/m.220992 type:complete len:202 (-) Transcript_75360:103-708(-)
MCVMSWPMQITPRMFPYELMCGAALRRKVTGSFQAVATSTSKFGVDWPAKASDSTRCASARQLSRTKLRNSLPTTWSLAKPVTSMTRRFHSMTQPVLSTPTMGAVAVSIMCLISSALRMASDFCLFSSVMSWPTPMTPVILPSAPLRVVALSRISRRCPSLVHKGNTKLDESTPVSSAIDRTCSTPMRSPSGTKLAISNFP